MSSLIDSGLELNTKVFFVCRTKKNIKKYKYKQDEIIVR